MDGIILINKPKGVTSHDIVYKVKKLFNKKVGHTGTLDPNATGVLPILVGDGTKLSKYLIKHDKIYKATLKLGIKTDTADIEGKVLEERTVENSILEKENIEKVLESFLGKQEQTPPIYSAIKVKGKKLYEYARCGKDVDIPKRIIEIMSIKLEKINMKEKTIEFKVHCSKGTYIRSLCEDIANKLGNIGFMKELERIKVGDFFIEDSIDIKDLEQNINNINYIKSHFITIEKLFEKKDRIELDNKKLDLFLNGVKLSTNKKDGLYKTYTNNKFIGIGIIEDGKLKRDIIIL